MARTIWVALISVVLLSITACGRNRVVQTVPPIPAAATVEPPLPAPPPEATPDPSPSPVVESDAEIFSRKTLEQLNAEGPLGHVYFDLDSARVRDSDRTVLQQNAEWLRRWDSTRVVIEGHCDSRGSAEYNLALGDRRAVAVREYLVSLGVPSERIGTLSKGKEQPRCYADTEDCWQQNRRGHFLIVAK